MKKNADLNFAAFPVEAVTHSERWICLACVLDVFIRHLRMAPRTAYSEVTKYTPTVAELTSDVMSRPFFVRDGAKDPCPYCQSPGKWHARLEVHRIEGGKATDIARRELVKTFPKRGDAFAVLEEKATRQHAFFDWLEKLSETLDFDDPRWLREIALHWLNRKLPKIDWTDLFQQTKDIRRSRRFDEGWEIDTGRLYVAPMLFDELLLVQYLVSRSHKAGGLTFEGRYTLPELMTRLRRSGYLRSSEVVGNNPSDALEQLLLHLAGGEASVKFYYIVDRREYLERAKAVKDLPLRRPVRAKK